MKQLAVVTLSLVFAAGAAGCSSSSPNTPTASGPTFTAVLSPANEVPPVSNGESTGSGNATITFSLTKDAQGNITAGTATFVVNLTGFPNGTPINIAHIHVGAAGVAGGIVFSTTLSTADAVVLANGSGFFTKPGIPPSTGLATMQAIINNPSGYYFNVHSTLNPAGVARGQLVLVQ